MVTLTVTSPLTKNGEVKRAQLALSGENVWRQDFLQGKTDGEFGEATGRACRRAKFWLGYSEKKLHATYGDTLDRLLTGKTKLPAANKVRRAARLAAAKRKPLGERAFNWLLRYEGLTESPAGSNRVLFSAWYGMVGPWCAMAVTNAYTAVGSKAFQRGRRWAYVPYIITDARAGRNGLALTVDPKRGDLVCFDWTRDGVYDHVGLFDRWLTKAAGTFATLEGNTSADDRGSQSNGGGLFRRSRSVNAARVLFIRVGR
jgi:hypothetical protein